MKYALTLVDVCACDFWRGASYPFFQVPVDKSTTLKDVQSAMRSEYAQEQLQGNDDWVSFINAHYIPDPEKIPYWEEANQAIFAAINALKAKDYKSAIRDIPVSETGETIYAYFRLIDLKTGQSPELPF